MTEIELHQPTSPLQAEMDYARAVSSASMLPDAYRGKPADIMLAVGLGQSMGLSPAESLYRINVIKGKPTASAELIAANVRKAGHRLRVIGDDRTCTATIIRADDPDFEFSITRDVAWAKSMGLAGNANYQKQPGTMLQWRAITAVARLACPEALYGVAYTPDEMYDMGGGEPQAAPQTGRERLNEALGRTAEPVDPEPAEDFTPDPITDKQLTAINAAVSSLGLTREQKLAGVAAVIGREVESTKDLTKDEATQVYKSLKSREELQAASEVVEAELVANPTTAELPDGGAE